MTGEELYQAIKDAISYFGLTFSSMDQIEVMAHEGYVEFSYGERTCSVTTRGKS